MPRITLDRAFFIPADAVKVQHKASSAVAYIYQGAGGQPAAMVFAGRRQKPDWRYRFRSEAEREKSVARFFAAVQEREAITKQRRQRERGLEVGDILSAHWGYEQTNVDYFEITALIGKSMVEIREIGREREETSWQQGKSVPAPGLFIGEPMRRKAAAGGVKVDESRWASKIEPVAMIGDKPVYAAEHWTAYH